MQFATRLADPETTSIYPLACAEPAQWIRESRDAWRIELALPPIPAKHIIVPSFATLHAGYRFQFKLADLSTEVALQPVPAENSQGQGDQAKDNKTKDNKTKNRKTKENRANDDPPNDKAPDTPQTNPQITAHIDCWHTSHEVKAAQLHLRVCTHSRPERYLIALTVRPLDHATREFELPDHTTRLRQPRKISQMRGPKPIRQRICSPTALAMALTNIEPPVDWAATVAACYDPLTRAYGSWPLALHWASQQGRLGAVETFSGWSEVGRILEQGTPMVCSIRFASGELTNAPLKQTSGHLVTLYGVDRNVAYVLDPAGKNIREVARKYDLQEFSRAWLARRGAAYVFCSDP